MVIALTDGMAKSNIVAHVHALFSNKSLNNPAAMPPKIPPTSNKVDKSALCSAVRMASKTHKNNIIIEAINNVVNK